MPLAASWDSAGIPFKGKIQANLRCGDCELTADVAWPELQLALCDSENLSKAAAFEERGWRFMNVDSDPQRIREVLKGDN